MNVSENDEIIALTSRAGQLRSQIVPLDASMNLIRHMGFVKSAADRHGVRSVDFGRQRLYVATDGQLRAYKIWRALVALAAAPSIASHRHEKNYIFAVVNQR